MLKIKEMFEKRKKSELFLHGKLSKKRHKSMNSKKKQQIAPSDVDRNYSVQKQLLFKNADVIIQTERFDGAGKNQPFCQTRKYIALPTQKINEKNSYEMKTAKDPFDKKLESFWTKISHFVRENILNILGAATTLITLLTWLAEQSYARKCSDYYGINKRYFSGGFFDEKMLFFTGLVLLICLIVLYSIISTKIQGEVLGRLGKAEGIIFTGYLLSVLNVVCLVRIYNSWVIPRAGVSYVKVLFGVAVGVILLADVMLIHFIYNKKFFVKGTILKKWERRILGVSVAVFLLLICCGFAVTANYGIEDVRQYEVIDGTQAIVSVYEGNLVVMDCEIREETLYLKKGVYRIETMANHTITYREFAKVVCDYSK